MLAGLLALMLASSDTTMRVALPMADTLMAEAIVVSPVTDTVRRADDELTVTGTPRLHAAALTPLALAGQDTVRKKRKLVEYSDWYGRRLTIHKALSWTMLPLFAMSYYTGERLARDGRQGSPEWVRKTHPYVATADAVVFGVNTVTGLWNLWDSRHDPEGRTRRIIHSVLFIAADAGFAYAGSIGREGREDGSVRDRHRTIALSSMGVSTLGWVIMLFRD